MTAVEWFSNKAYELFEQYSEGKFDRIELNKLMLETTNKAKEMEKEQMILLVEQLKDYTREAQCILGNDEREASEFVDIFLQQNL